MAFDVDCINGRHFAPADRAGVNFAEHTTWQLARIADDRIADDRKCSLQAPITNATTLRLHAKFCYFYARILKKTLGSSDYVSLFCLRLAIQPRLRFHRSVKRALRTSLFQNISALCAHASRVCAGSSATRKVAPYASKHKEEKVLKRQPRFARFCSLRAGRRCTPRGSKPRSAFAALFVFLASFTMWAFAVRSFISTEENIQQTRVAQTLNTP